jgi:hypothetical protein
MAAAGAAGSKYIAKSTTPSFSICCWTLSFSGKVRPSCQRFGRSASYHAQSGAVTVSKFASVAGACRAGIVGDKLHQRLLEEGGAHEVRRHRMRHPPRVRRRPVDEIRGGGGGLGDAGGVVGKTKRASRQGDSSPSVGTVKSVVAAEPGERSR